MLWSQLALKMIGKPRNPMVELDTPIYGTPIDIDIIRLRYPILRHAYL